MWSLLSREQGLSSSKAATHGGTDQPGRPGGRQGLSPGGKSIAERRKCSCVEWDGLREGRLTGLGLWKALSVT